MKDRRILREGVKRLSVETLKGRLGTLPTLIDARPFRGPLTKRKISGSSALSVKMRQNRLCRPESKHSVIHQLTLLKDAAPVFKRGSILFTKSAEEPLARSFQERRKETYDKVSG